MKIFLVFFISLIRYSWADNFELSRNNPSVRRLIEYLKIDTSHPIPQYRKAVHWLKHQADDIGLEFFYEIYGSFDSFAVLLTWKGMDPSLEAVMFGSHIDTVFVDKSKWKYNPYIAHMDEGGNIFARGAADMKATTVATLEAIRNLKAMGYTPQRNWIMAVFPDEEMFNRGVKGFVNSKKFTCLNLGLMIDEGPGGNQTHMFLANRQKVRWQAKFIAKGTATHSSAMPKMTALERLSGILSRMTALRQEQFGLPEEEQSSINLVKIGGGNAPNVLPDELWAHFDFRLAPTPKTLRKIESVLIDIASMDEDNIEIQFIQKDDIVEPTVVGSESKWWPTFELLCSKMNKTCATITQSAVTDGRFIRAKGIPTYAMGFVEGSGLHAPNEHVNIASFFRGMDKVAMTIQALTS